MEVKTLLKASGAVLAVGVLFGAGLRISQWLIPVPPVRISLCESPAADASCVLSVDEDTEPPVSLLEQLAPPPLPAPSSRSI